MKTLGRLSFLTAMALLGATGASAQGNLAGTGFAWYPGGGGCQILGGDSSAFIYTNSNGRKFAFGSGPGCAKEMALDGPVRIYQISSLDPKPGLVVLTDDRGDRWSFLKMGPNNYQRRKLK